jgi:uncharacterized membrane protein YgcG
LFVYSKFNSKFTELTEESLLFEVPADCAEYYTSALFSFAEVQAQLALLETCAVSEGLAAESTELVEVQTRWLRFEQQQRKAVVELGDQCQTLQVNTSDAEAKQILGEIMKFAASADASALDSVSVLWHPLLLLMRCAQRVGAISMLTGRIYSIVAFWNTSRRELISEYQWFEQRCSKALSRLCPLNLDKLVQLVRQYGGGSSNSGSSSEGSGGGGGGGGGADFSSCDVVALCGPTGVGKSTLIHYLHGARFREVRHVGALRVHLDPYYPDDDRTDGAESDSKAAAAVKDLAAVKTNPFGESETIHVHSSPLVFNGNPFVLLDTPGFGETKSMELDVVNGLNISAALKACRSVRLVVVLSDNCLGDKMLGENTLKDCSHTVVEMVTSPEYIDKFSYVFTKMAREQGATISSAFSSNASRLAQQDVNIRPLWQDIARKTVPAGAVVGALHDTPREREELRSYVFGENNAIGDPRKAFGLCIPRRSREALGAQLTLHRASVERALQLNNLALLRLRLQQLRALCEQPKLAQLPECPAELHVCTQIVVDAVEKQFTALHALLTSGGSAGASAVRLSQRDCVQLVGALASVLVFEETRRNCLVLAAKPATGSDMFSHLSSQYVDRDLAAESMSLVCGYVVEVSQWLQGYASDCTVKSAMATFLEVLKQLVAIRTILLGRDMLSFFQPVVDLLNQVLSQPPHHNLHARERGGAGAGARVGGSESGSGSGPGSGSGSRGEGGSQAQGGANVIDAVVSIGYSLQKKYETSNANFDLVGALNALHGASHYVEVFKLPLADLKHPLDSMFYSNLQKDFVVQLSRWQRDLVQTLACDTVSVEAASATARLERLGVVDVPMARNILVALSQLKRFLKSAAQATGRSSRSGYTEFNVHLKDCDVDDLLSSIESVAEDFVNCKSVIMTDITVEAFQPADNKALLQRHWRNVCELVELPWEDARRTSMQDSVERAAAHFDSLCLQLRGVLDTQLHHLTIPAQDPKECDLPFLREKVVEVRESAFFHNKMHFEIQAICYQRIFQLHQQLKRVKAHQIDRIAVASFVVGALLDISKLVVLEPGRGAANHERRHISAVTKGITEQPVEPSTDLSGGTGADVETEVEAGSVPFVAEQGEKAAACVLEIRSWFRQCFFAEGIYVLEPFYNALSADYASIAVYMQPSSGHFSLEKTYLKFLEQCSASEWCFPTSAAAAADEEEESILVSHREREDREEAEKDEDGHDAGGSGFVEGKEEADSTGCIEPSLAHLKRAWTVRTMQLGCHVRDLRNRLQVSFPWLFCPDLATQLRVMPFPISLAANGATLGDLEVVLEYLRQYEPQGAAEALYSNLREGFLGVAAVMQKLLLGSAVEKYAIENIQMLAKELATFDRFFNVSSEFKFIQLGKDAVAVLIRTQQTVERSIESHDFGKVAGLLRMIDPSDEYYTKVVDLLRDEISSVVVSIVGNGTLFNVLVVLHQALLFVGSHLRKKEIVAAIKDKVRSAECVVRNTLASAVQPIKSGNFLSPAAELQWIHQLLCSCNPECVALTGTLCAGELQQFSCFLCGFQCDSGRSSSGGGSSSSGELGEFASKATLQEVATATATATTTCTNCSAAQYFHARSELSPVVEELHRGISAVHRKCVQDLECRLTSMGSLVGSICEGGPLDLDLELSDEEDDDDDFFDDPQQLLSAKTANLDKKLFKKFRWVKQGSADLLSLAAQYQQRTSSSSSSSSAFSSSEEPFLDWRHYRAELEGVVQSSLTPLVDKAQRCRACFDTAALKFYPGALMGVEEFQTSLRDVTTRMNKCGKLLAKAYFAPYKPDFKTALVCLQSAEESIKKSREEIMLRGDLLSLVKLNQEQQIPTVLATLRDKFSKFREAAAAGDLGLAFDLVSKEGDCWLIFDEPLTKASLHQLASRFGKLLPATQSLVQSTRATDMEFMRSNHHVIVLFIQFAAKWKDVLITGTAKDIQALTNYANRAQSIVDSTTKTFRKYATDIDGILTSLEQTVPELAEAAYALSTVVNFNDASRLHKIWKEVRAFDDVFQILSDTHDETEPGGEEQEKKRKHVRVLCSVHERLTRLSERSLAILNLPFVNSKTDTQNRTDKDIYFSLVSMCYSILELVCEEETLEGVAKEINDRIFSFGCTCVEDLKQLNVEASLEEATNVSENFNKTFNNLLSIQQLMACFGAASGKETGKVDKAFDGKVEDLVNASFLPTAKWNNWATHIPVVAKQLILLKTIARSIPVYGSKVEESIKLLLTRYKHRCETDEIAKEFIAKLGLELEGSTSNGLGQKIIEDTVMFAGYKNQLRNLQFERVGIEEVLANIPWKESKTELRFLFKDFQTKYWKIVDKGLSPHTRFHVLDEIPRRVKWLAMEVKLGSRVADNLFEIVVNCFAFWTLNNLKGYDSTPTGDAHKPRHYLTQPHPGQVVVVLRLLGLDNPNALVETPKKKGDPSLFEAGAEFFSSIFSTSKKGNLKLQNHLAQIRTGEGKSIVLAITATVLALVGFDVDIACYSDYLTTRDKGAFQFMFDAFVVEKGVNPIQYNTFKALCENILKSKGDMRELMASTILAKTRPAVPAPRPTKATRPRVLLADEVDVLFGSDFFGRSYNMLASLRSSAGEKEIENLIRFIWTFRNKKKDAVWLNELVPSPQYQACLARFSEWPFLVENVAKRMLHDVWDTEHQVDHVDPIKGIGYYDSDNVLTYTRRDGYKTLFAYMRENEADKSKISDKMVLDEMNFLVNAGTLSYAELPKLYSLVLGVTGTLDTLSAEENNLLDQKYNIKKRTIMPSAYPVYKTAVPFFQGKLGVDVIIPGSAGYFQTIANEIERRILANNGKSRAVLVFFQKEITLEDFWNSDSFKGRTGTALKLVKSTSAVDRDGIIAKSVEEGRVTLLIAQYGRGTDFTYNNRELDERGGIHVIQTFLSEDSSEEIQIQGRTARQGHPGTFSMVLSESDLESSSLSRADVASASDGFDIHSIVKINRATSYQKKCQEKQELADYMLVEHKASQELLKCLWENNIPEVKRLIQQRNLARIEFAGVISKTVILLDGTYSMHSFFNKCKTTIKEMLTRIAGLLVEQRVTCGFEVQFVVYRNYNSLKKIVQASGWASDPETLFEFIDATHVDGGWGNEAIEMGLWHVNQEIAKKSAVSQVILIGDMPPNSKQEVQHKRESVESEGMKGGSYWEQKTPFVDETFYKTELEKIAQQGIPIHARYLQKDAKKAFEEMASRTGGTAGALDIDRAEGAEQLTGIFAASILKNIQDRKALAGQGTTDLYQAYLNKFPFADVGFV